jgi:hypothetical protein
MRECPSPPSRTQGAPPSLLHVIFFSAACLLFFFFLFSLSRGISLSRELC